jgi:hypothetical protein
MERSLARLVHAGRIPLREAERLANRPATFNDEMQRPA